MKYKRHYTINTLALILLALLSTNLYSVNSPLGFTIRVPPQADISHPAAVWVNNRIHLFARGKNNHLLHKQFSRGRWGRWINLGGALSTAPTAVSPSPGRIDVFIGGQNRKLVQRTWINNRWGGWINHGGLITSSPSAVSTALGKIDVFARDKDSKLIRKAFKNNRWGRWSKLDGLINHVGLIKSAPFAVVYNSAPASVARKVRHARQQARAVRGVKKIIVFARNYNNELVWRKVTERSHGRFLSLGGTISAMPSAITSENGGIQVLVRGANAKLVSRYWNGRRWGGWKNHGGNITSAPYAVKTANNRVELFARGTRDNVLQRSRVNAQWRQWRNLGGQLRGRMYARIKFLTHNVYSLKKKFCSSRGKAFGMIVSGSKPAYDFIGVQEFYGGTGIYKICASKHLSRKINAKRTYANIYSKPIGQTSIRRITSRHNYLHNPRPISRFNGGVGIFSKQPIVEVYEKTWNNDTKGKGRSKLKGAEGFIFSRIKIRNRLSKTRGFIYLDVYVVHVNSGRTNTRYRQEQIKQLVKYIKKTSAKSGNPVIVMGDFNIGGPPTYNGNESYGHIFNYLGFPNDLWMDAHPKKPGFTFDCNNPVATCKTPYQNRIDYILLINNRKLTNSKYKLVLHKLNNINIQKMPFSIKKGTKKLFASDHYGLSATLEIREK